MKSEFSDKIAVVTGAAKGIGHAVAEALLQSGATVAAFDIDRETLGREVDRWKAQGHNVSPHFADVSNRASVNAAFDAVEADHGHLHYLVNAAGVVRYGRVEDISEEDWDFVMDTNAKSVFLTARRAIPLMRAAGAGSIVNFASVQAVASQQTVAAYAASKGAIVSLTRTLALDHAAEGIRVNCILPGSVETPMLRQGAETFAPTDPMGAMKAWGALHPLGFLAQPEDLAEIALFLLSDKARVITGTPLIADEGLLAKLGI